MPWKFAEPDPRCSADSRTAVRAAPRLLTIAALNGGLWIALIAAAWMLARG